MELNSTPGGAVVFVDGKKKGETPETEGQKLTMELPEGDHVITVKKEGEGETTKKIFVGEGVIQPITLTIEPIAFTNFLGMKFVPVPGTHILMCIHEARKKDYSAYAVENSDVNGDWRSLSLRAYFGNTVLMPKDDSNYPVLKVSWDEAKAFCKWLKSKDGRTYRLPTDHEWSCAVGIGDRENAHDTPKAKNGKISSAYPWGSGWPPRGNNIGNYCDATAVRISNGELNALDLVSYVDGYPCIAPVMRYPANKFGLFDLGGNVDEWCEDFLSPNEEYKVIRGGNWIDCQRHKLLSSYRSGAEPHGRGDTGIRCVIDLDDGKITRTVAISDKKDTLAETAKEENYSQERAQDNQTGVRTNTPSNITLDLMYTWDVKVWVGRKYSMTNDTYESSYTSINTEVKAKTRSEAERIAVSQSYTARSAFLGAAINVEPAGTQGAKFRCTSAEATRQ